QPGPRRTGPDRTQHALPEHAGEHPPDHHRGPPRHHAGAPRAARRDARAPSRRLRLVAVAYRRRHGRSFHAMTTGTDTPRFDHPPRPMAQRVGAILWPSFFAAGVCTMVFFAFVDPLELRDMTFPEMPISRGLGYTIGFFMFWLATASS